jgi:acrylyl-CoA reductase (NADPH)
MNDFKAIIVNKAEGGTSAVLGRFSDADLMAGDVTVRVTHSTLNYKDALAITGNAPVVRRFPMIPGIDFAGVVEISSHPEFREGDDVILNGWGAGEVHLGGYAERARVSGDWLLRRPPSITAAEAMAIGTAGYTAMLAVMAIERHGIVQERGPIVVTGASGGVGSVAIALLSGLGWTVIASTGKIEEIEYLRALGATEIIPRSELNKPSRPIGKERWAAGIDSVGSMTLASILSMTKYGGAVAACGLAGGMDLPASVAPFILRGVSLLGIDSVMASSLVRKEAWSRLSTDLDRGKLASMVRTVGLEDVLKDGAFLLSGASRGRIVIEI